MNHDSLNHANLYPPAANREAASKPSLQSILQHSQVRQGRDFQPSAGFVPTGRNDLDPLLPEGWPLGGLTEILVPKAGVGELSLLMPTLAKLSSERRWLAWVAPPHTPYAPALAAHGIDLSRVLLIHPKAVKDSLWAVEQALRSGTCGAVMVWLQNADFQSLRRLQLAAAEGQSLCLIFRPYAAAAEASPAALRLKLEAIPEGVRALPVKYHGGRSGPLSVKLGRSAVNARMAMA